MKRIKYLNPKAWKHLDKWEIEIEKYKYKFKKGLKLTKEKRQKIYIFAIGNNEVVHMISLQNTYN